MFVQTQSTDSLGCAKHHLHQDRELAGDGIRFYRKRTDGAEPSQVVMPASERGFLLGVSMGGGHRRRIFQGRRASQHEFDAQSIYIRDFADDYRAELLGPFDFVLLELSPAFFEGATDARMGRRVTGLECVTGMPDAVLSSLAWALAPALERPHETSRLFIDQMGMAMGTYLVEHYGGAASCRHRPRRRVLSRQHESRAKDLLRSRLDGDVSIGAVADACNLSRSHFTRAFRETTGHTPHQWLQRQRVEIARSLLLDSQLSLAEIATACGFADQSHLTRVFAQAVGMPPGAWRRNAAR